MGVIGVIFVSILLGAAVVWGSRFIQHLSSLTAKGSGLSNAWCCFPPNCAYVNKQLCTSTQYSSLSACQAACQPTPTCGNSIVEGAEECDDGNLASGDGCSASCEVEAVCGDGSCDMNHGENSTNCPADCLVGLPPPPPADCQELGEGCGGNLPSCCPTLICSEWGVCALQSP